MKTLPVIYSAGANRQIDSIQRYIARQGSPLNAEQYVHRIRAFCDRLGMAPSQGEIYPNHKANFRKVGFEDSATIVFVVVPDALLIVGVYRKGRDVQRHL